MGAPIAAVGVRTLSAILVATALGVPRWAHGDVDLTGDWSFLGEVCPGSCFPTSGTMQVVQSGSTISITLAEELTLTGPIGTPAPLIFQVSAPDACGTPDNRLTGEASPDGNTISASGQVWVRFPSPGMPCFLASVSLTAQYIGSCGNGTLDAGETCDDGNRVLFDCCSPTCQLDPAGTPCRAPAGACDVGEVCTGTSPFCPPDPGPPDADGDGVGDLCDPCPANPSTVVLAKPRLGLASYDALAGNDKLSLKAELPLSSAAPSFIDPVADGIEIAIGAAGEPGSLGIMLPAGAYDPMTGQGWSVAKSGRKWSFRGTDALLPVTKAAVKLAVDRRGPRAAVTASGKRRSFADTLPAVPLSLGLVLDPPRATSLTCGGVVFSAADGARPACEPKAHGTALSCR